MLFILWPHFRHHISQFDVLVLLTADINSYLFHSRADYATLFCKFVANGQLLALSTSDMESLLNECNYVQFDNCSCNWGCCNWSHPVVWKSCLAAHFFARETKNDGHANVCSKWPTKSNVMVLLHRKTPFALVYQLANALKAEVVCEDSKFAHHCRRHCVTNFFVCCVICNMCVRGLPSGCMVLVARLRFLIREWLSGENSCTKRNRVASFFSLTSWIYWREQVEVKKRQKTCQVVQSSIPWQLLNFFPRFDVCGRGGVKL